MCLILNASMHLHGLHASWYNAKEVRHDRNIKRKMYDKKMNSKRSDRKNRKTKW